MMRVTKDNVDLLVSNVRGRDYLERELGIRTALGNSEPVVKVDNARKLAEIAAVTGKSMERLSGAKRLKYGGIVFTCFEVEERARNGRRFPWA